MTTSARTSTRYHRLALAQLAVNPAYLDSSGVSYLHEPAFAGEDPQGLHRLHDIPEVQDLRSRIAQAYEKHIVEKIKTVAEFAAYARSELLVLPEYAVPPIALEVCRDLAVRLSLAIVAGSHTATQQAIEQYRRLGIKIAEDEILKRAVCPVFLPDGKCYLFQKIARSKWESEMVPGTASAPISVSLNGEAVQLEVLICLDALHETIGPKYRTKQSVPSLLAIPSLTPSVELFYSKSSLVLASGRCVIFTNTAEFGGSRIFARSERYKGWRIGSDGTEPLPKNEEALIVAEIDLLGQFETRGSTAEIFPVREIRTYPIVYSDFSGASRDYASLVTGLNSSSRPNLAVLKQRLMDLAGSPDLDLPGLLRAKIRHFIDHVVEPGLAGESEWTEWLETVVVVSTQPTNALRLQLCAESISLITKLIMTPRYAKRVDDLSRVFTYLARRHAELTVFVASGAGDALALTHKSDENAVAQARPGSFESPFFNREADLDSVRKFIEANNRACMVLAGMRGIGKTSIIREVFKKVVLPTWTRVVIQATEGMSFARLLAEIAFRLDLQVSPDVPVDPISQADMSQNVLLRISQTPRIAIVIDDFQYLLNANGEIEDPETRLFVLKLLRSVDVRKNKIIIATTHVPVIEDEDVRRLVESRYMMGLDPINSESLFSFWFRFEREDLAGQAPEFPERLVSLLHGHPLAVKTAAKLRAEQVMGDVASDLALFKRLRETMVPFLMERVTLAPHEEEFLKFASVFRVPVSPGPFIAWKGDEAIFLIQSLLGRSLLESDGETYQLHPIIRDHFYMSSSLQTLRPFHKIAGLHFLEQYRTARKVGEKVEPGIVGEAVHHLLCANERDKVREFGLYGAELRPVALMHYRKQEYELALKDYRLLADLDPTNHDAHFHLALLYGNDGKWDVAERHFDKAISLKPNGFWILQGYAHALLRHGRLPEAEQYLKEANQINRRHVPTLVDLGRVYARTDRAEKAEHFFQSAIEADPENTRAYVEFARFCKDQGRFQRGLELALAALTTNPVDPRNKELVKELRKRLEDAS